MFSTRNQLRKRTPENGTDRENFLTLLVDEYLQSSLFDGKCQVLANLANFAYDPLNYGYIRDVGVLDIFLHVLKRETNEKLVHYASAGICNLCIDPENAQYILKNLGIEPLQNLLQSKKNDTVANAITALLYLNDQFTLEHSKEITESIKELVKSEDKRLVNLASIYLQDVSKEN